MPACLSKGRDVQQVASVNNHNNKLLVIREMTKKNLEFKNIKCLYVIWLLKYDYGERGV